MESGGLEIVRLRTGRGNRGARGRPGDLALAGPFSGSLELGAFGVACKIAEFIAVGAFGGEG
jgi:hypothetical protein